MCVITDYWSSIVNLKKQKHLSFKYNFKIETWLCFIFNHLINLCLFIKMRIILLNLFSCFYRLFDVKFM